MRWMVLALALVGCGADDDADRPGPCDEETRNDVVAPGLLADSNTEDLVVELVEANEAPPIVGDNEWVIELRDGAGAAVEACVPTVTPWMPDHNHGTTADPEVTEEGGGRYRVGFEPIMGGYWEITVAADCGAPVVGEAVFKVCVET